MLFSQFRRFCLLAALLIPAAARAQTTQVGCADCHKSQADELGSSVHTALTCADCHGGAMEYAVAAEALAAYRRGDSTTFDHGASFRGKATRAEVPDRCGGCHADVEWMNPYGLRIDQLARYWTSGHGKAIKAGDDRAAVCTDCHGSHDILAGVEPASRTHPRHVPGTCATCHADKALMDDYDLPVEVVHEYWRSVHGKLLIEQGDTGAPTCATCHGNHSATPPGFASVGAVCGQCHAHAAKQFATSVHASQEFHKGCVQCHGGGEGRHFHEIERITKPPGLLIERYAHLLTTEPKPTAERIREAIHPDPERIIRQALPTCLDCHEELEDDESLPKLFELINRIAAAEETYVETANRLDRVSQGVLLVTNQRFKFEEAKTHLIELAPLQHTLNNEVVAAKVAELDEVCAAVNAELDELEAGLRMRTAALAPVWGFTVFFAMLLYVKYKRLRRAWVASKQGS
jgi:protein-arginine kinase activator protein McsA